MKPEITTTDNKSRVSLPKWIWICLAVLAGFTYFFGLSIPLLGPDEPRYAQVAREMFERGDWITPTLGGYNWFEKPALLYWLEIVSFSIFGVSESSARLGPALLGLGTVAALWILGKNIATKSITNAKTTEPTAIAPFATRSFDNWLALIAASTLGLIVFSRGASFDITVTFPLTAALVSFFLFDDRHRHAAAIAAGSDTRRRTIFPLILFYVFIGVALLAKGLIGIVFPFAIVAFYYILSRRTPSRMFIISLFWGTLLALAVAAVWYLPMYLRHGWEFIDEFFLQHHFQRYTSNKYKHPQPFYFFLWVLPLMTLPWMPFFFAALWRTAKDFFWHKDAKKDANSSFSPIFLFSASWLLVPLVFFSLSGSKLPGYILPSVPPAIIITTLYVVQLVNRSHWRIVVIGLATATLVTTIILLATAVPQFAGYDSVKALIAAGDARGFKSSRVLTMHTVSHNAEFYAAGRLLRDKNGKQKKIYGVSEILNIIANEGGKPVLVLVPLEYQHQLTNAAQLKSEVLGNNGELAIVVVSAE